LFPFYVAESSAVGQHILWVFVRLWPRVAFCSSLLPLRTSLSLLAFLLRVPPPFVLLRLLSAATTLLCTHAALWHWCVLLFVALFSYIRLLFRFRLVVSKLSAIHENKPCFAKENDIVSTQQFDILKLEQVLY